MQTAHTNNGVADFLRQLRIHGGGDKAMSSALGITGGCRRGELTWTLKALGNRVSRLRHNSDIIFRFISCWMQTLPYQYRKEVSRFGAIRSTHRKHPVHGVCDHIGPYFDPTNHWYAMALAAVCPQIQTLGFNECTLGDICEALLAVGMKSLLPSSRTLAVKLEGVVSLLYIVACDLSIWTLADLDDWCNAVFVPIEVD